MVTPSSGQGSMMPVDPSMKTKINQFLPKTEIKGLRSLIKRVFEEISFAWNRSNLRAELINTISTKIPDPQTYRKVQAIADQYLTHAKEIKTAPDQIASLTPQSKVSENHPQRIHDLLEHIKKLRNEGTFNQTALRIPGDAAEIDALYRNKEAPPPNDPSTLVGLLKKIIRDYNSDSRPLFPFSLNQPEKIQELKEVLETKDKGAIQSFMIEQFRGREDDGRLFKEVLVTLNQLSKRDAIDTQFLSSVDIARAFPLGSLDTADHTQAARAKDLPVYMAKFIEDTSLMPDL